MQDAEDFVEQVFMPEHMAGDGIGQVERRIEIKRLRIAGDRQSHVLIGFHVQRMPCHRLRQAYNASGVPSVNASHWVKK